MRKQRKFTAIVSLLLCCIMVLGLLPGTAHAATSAEIVVNKTDESGNPYIEEKTGDLLYTMTEDEFIRNGGAIFRERQDEDGIWERGEKISGGFAVMCDRSTAGKELYMDHDCYWIAEVDA